MAYCRNCGGKLGEGDSFCTSCGAKVDLTDIISGDNKQIQMEQTGNNYSNYSNGNNGNSGTGGKGGNEKTLLAVIVACIFLVGIIAAVVAAVFIYNGNKKEEAVEKTVEVTTEETTVEETTTVEVTTVPQTTKEPVTENKAEKIGFAKELYKQYKKRFSSANKNATRKGVTGNKKVKKYKKKVSKLLDYYDDALISGNLKKLSKLKPKLEKNIKRYGISISKAKKPVKKKKSGSRSGGVSMLPSVRNASYLEFAISDSDLYECRVDPFAELPISDVDRYALCIIARNEIYARYGAHFKTASLRGYFNSTSWYTDKGISTATVEGMLSSVEKKNVQNLLGWQNYYEAYLIGDTGKAADFSASDYINVMRYRY
jgi:hypothetical protein